MLKVWNMILVLMAYLLGIFGTFITRSGVVNSVHAFADSSLGKYFLLLHGVVASAPLYLIIDRLPSSRASGRWIRYSPAKALPVQQPDVAGCLLCRPLGHDVSGSHRMDSEEQNHRRASRFLTGSTYPSA